jgi:methionyl-tRNA synthetase
VWFDAPIGYISATKEAVNDDWKKWWQDKDTDWIAFLGKDNIVFHTILFPAMLLAHNDADAASNYQLPENVPANEFMNLQSQKLSKSRGWTVEVHELLDRYPADTIRYAFATMLPETKDSDFLWKEFQSHVNNELADIFGNFANRVLTFVSRNFDNRVPDVGALDTNGEALLAHFGERAKAIAELYQRFRLREATMETVDLARSANKYFNDAEPWKLIKQARDAAARVMLSCLEAVRALGAYFDPITPNASAKIRTTLGTTLESWSDTHQPKLTGGQELGTIEILFQKIEDEAVIKEIELLETMAHAANIQTTVAASAPKEDALITIDDFKKIKLRTAKVLEAERVPKSKKLLRLQIAVGSEQRQIVAGIGEKYTPESLVGKSIVVVANLQPAKLMGNESNGMLLAVNDDNGVVTLVAPDAEAAPGLEVR